MFKFAAVCLVLLGCQEGKAITGGSSTTVLKHPYQVAIDQIVTGSEGSHFEFLCSGALLTRRTVVTAASCLTTDGVGRVVPANLQVRVGAQFREAGGEAYGVAGLLSHPDYSAEAGHSDAALLYLDADVPPRAEVQAVALADPNKGLAAGEAVLVSGFGDLHAGERPADGELRQLQAVSLPVFNADLCGELYHFAEHDNRACAGGWKSGVCGKGDIGAPVVNWLGQLVGIAQQQGPACGVPGQPTVFQSLVDADVWAWVDENIDPPAPAPAS